MAVTRSVAFLLFIFCFLVAGWAVSANIALANRPCGDLLQECQSPDGRYVISFYQSCTGGLTNTAITIGRLADSATGEKRVFYVQPSSDKLSVSWQDGYVVMVNGGPKIDVRQDTLDYRETIRSGWWPSWR